jgi:hypothetical protein
MEFQDHAGAGFAMMPAAPSLPGGAVCGTTRRPKREGWCLMARLKRMALVMLVVAALSLTAQTADSMLTLACQGTVTDMTTDQSKPEPISMGLIINFTTGAVRGFSYPGMDFSVKITGMNDVTLAFGGSSPPNDALDWSISGSIDRVTGDVEATSRVSNRKTHVNLANIGELLAEM